MNDIDVSVWMIVYNHENYIEKALNSILNQENDFKMEIIIGEDCSTDNTREIIRQFEAKYPEIIKPIYYSKNVGVQENFAKVMEQCKGDYIALCEGDDYWTDPKKLQKQVDFLKSNDSYAMACNSSEEIDEKGTVFKIASRDNSMVSLSDVLKEGWFIRTASMVFNRKAIEGGFPSFFYEAYSTDYILQIMILKQGKCKYFPEVMSSYRHHTGGISKGSKALQVKRWVKKIKLLAQLNEYTSFEFETEVKQHQNKIKSQISFYLVRYPALLKALGWSFYVSHLNIFLAIKDGLNRIKKRI